MKQILIKFFEEFSSAMINMITLSNFFEGYSYNLMKNGGFKLVKAELFLIVSLIATNLKMKFFKFFSPFYKLFKRLQLRNTTKTIELEDKYDYIILGAGHVGCYMAKRLLDLNYRILLIGQEPNIEYTDKFPFGNIFDTKVGKGELNYGKNRFEWYFEKNMYAFARSTTFGGTFNNSFAKIHFTDEFKKYEETVLKTWGVKLKSVPKKIRNKFCQEAKNITKGHNAKLAVDNTGKLHSTYDSLIKKHRNNPNLKIIPNKKVIKLNKSNNKIDSFIVEDTDLLNKIIFKVKDENIIMSAGPFANPHILHNSFNISDFSIKDHPCLSLPFELTESNTRQKVIKQLNDKNKYRGLLSRNLMYQEIPEIYSNITESYSFWNSNPELNKDNDILFIFSNYAIAATTYKNPRHNWRNNCVAVFVCYIGKDIPPGKYTIESNNKYKIQTTWHKDEKITTALWKATEYIRSKLSHLIIKEIDYNKRDTETKFKETLKDFNGILNSTHATCTNYIDENNIFNYKGQKINNLYLSCTSTLKSTSFRPLGNSLAEAEKLIEKLIKIG